MADALRAGSGRVTSPCPRTLSAKPAGQRCEAAVLSDEGLRSAPSRCAWLADRLRITRPAPTPSACPSLGWDDVLLDPFGHPVDHPGRALDRLHRRSLCPRGQVGD